MLILMILLLKHTLLVLYMIIVLIKVIAMTGRNVLIVVNWGGVDTDTLVCERGRESFYSSEIMSKEVNKAFDKELGKYNTLLIYNCHHCL